MNKKGHRAEEMPRLDYRGNGFFLYTDDQKPRMTDVDVARKVGGHLPKRVTHISSNHYEDKTLHVLQYSHLHKKDQERSSRKK
jgi:hypothetical protein